MATSTGMGWGRKQPSLEEEIRRLSGRERELLRRILHAGSDTEPVDEELEAARQGASKLTERERDVIEMLMGGARSKDIGKELAISPRTVEVYRSRAISKMQARSTPHLCVLATRLGFEPWESK